MGSHRTKEDDVAKISTSIYITNFPETCSAKDLFNTCKQYGHVVDVFIPSKRSKAGKRFGFVRFINVFNENENEVPALVLDDDCLFSKDLSKCLFGRVKEFASLANLKMTLNNEGFMDIKIQYMGEMWVMLEFASMDFVTKGRIAWVELEGKVFWIRAKETPGWVPDFLEDAKDEDQSDVDSKDGRSKVHESGSCEESGGGSSRNPIR
ncbi:nucleotide-binding alpha-beta plait domain-containing protein [Tanacetum coccineum]